MKLNPKFYYDIETNTRIFRYVKINDLCENTLFYYGKYYNFLDMKTVISEYSISIDNILSIKKSKFKVFPQHFTEIKIGKF